MKKFNAYLQKYLTFGFPFMLALMTWDALIPHAQDHAKSSFILNALWEIGSWNLMLWFLALFIFMVLLVFRKDTQEQSIKFLAGIKERDEREEKIMAFAARRAFVSTTGLLICLLFLSCFTLTIAKNPDQTTNGQKSSLTIGFKLSATDDPSTTNDGVMFEHKNLPLSKSGIILLVLIWQVVVFKIKARKELEVVAI